MKNLPIVIENPLTLFTGDGLDELLDNIKKEVINITPDTSTDKGRKAIATLARKVASSKVAIDNAGKELVSEWKNKAKIVDASRKNARDYLDNLRDEIRQPLSDWEAEEAIRIDKAKKAGTLLMDHMEGLEMNVFFDKEKDIEMREAELKKREMEEQAKKDAEKAEKERIAYELKIKEEAALAAKKEAQENVNAIKLEKERIEREKIEAAEKHEADRVEALRIAEREKIEAEEKVRHEAEQKAQAVEEKRLLNIAKKEAEELAIKLADEKKSKNKAHQKRINNETLKSLLANGVNEKDAKHFISIVAKGLIDNITINY